ncbi:MAG: NYN domain-containing protein [Trichormus sp. ATA11-4-KO1]|jgi:predicted nuclease of predicted toxin-antitoxin system|nr:NYN domain-containing protein [Trichormus sp. ATA11-4-KO1]
MTDIHFKSKGQTRQQKRLVSIYWDYQNTRLSLEQAKLLLDFAKSKGCIVSKNVYYNSQHQDQAAAKNDMANLGFNYLNVPCSLKNSADNQLIADCLEEIYSNTSSDIFILVSGDGDFVKLVHSLQKLGKQVIIFAQLGNVKQKLIELADEFYFVDKLLELVEQNNPPQTTAIESQINYNEAIECLIAAINTVLIQGKRTLFSNIDKLMRQICVNYKGYSSISNPTGKKFKSFSQFVDFAVKTGKIQTKNQELFLIDLEKITA